MPKTFAQLKEEIRRQIFVSGEPENLKGLQPDGSMGAHDLLFQEAMAEVAKWVECEQERNTDVVPFCATFFKCGLTVIPLPRGIITRVYTIANDEHCDPVDYEETDWPEPECRANNTLLQWQQPDVTGLPVLPIGFKQAEATTDRDEQGNIFGRARAGSWAKYDGKIWIWPWIQSNEKIIVTWRGIKTKWGEDDLVNEAQDYKKAIKLYVQYAHERDFGDPDKAVGFKNRAGTGWFDEALADLMYQCREEMRRRTNPQCSSPRARTSAELTDDAVPT